MTPIRALLASSVLLLAASGCGLSNQFYAELEEPGICKLVPDQVMDPTAPGTDLVLVFPVALPPNMPVFDAQAGGVTLKLLTLTFDAKSGIQDFDSVDTASISAVPDPNNNPNGLQPVELIRYDKAPGFRPGTKLTIGGNSDVDIVPYLDANNQVIVEARMTGGLPNNNWTADITGCLYAKARVNYLDAYGVHF